MMPVATMTAGIGAASGRPRRDRRTQARGIRTANRSAGGILSAARAASRCRCLEAVEEVTARVVEIVREAR